MTEEMAMDEETPMDDATGSIDRALVLDGNAAASLLHDVFGADVTVAPSQCGNCGNVAAVGALLAYTHAPGTVLRCGVCRAVVMRVVETPDSIYVEARGAAYLRLPRER